MDFPLVKYFSARIIPVLLIFISWSTSHIPRFEMEEVNPLMKPMLCSMGLDTSNCPVDGMWTSWGQWEDCSGSCGQTGLTHRYRSCTNPAPANNGQGCTGSRSESKLCHLPGCSLAEYESSSRCNEYQKDQFQVLEKIHSEHSSLISSCIEADCPYRTVEAVLGDSADSYWNALFCVKHSTGCPELGGWTSWSVFSDCTADCGFGERVQCRTCTNPVPVGSKYACRGENCSFSPCSGTKCDDLMSGSWSPWSSWTSCSASCGQGMRKRTRICTQDRLKSSRFPAKGDAYLNYAYIKSKRRTTPFLPSRDVCVGRLVDMKTCYLKDCPVDGEWSEWVQWSPCSSDCGIGLQSRSRACSNPPQIHGGDACFGPVTSIRHCFNAPCLDVVHRAVYLRGDGFLEYSGTGQSFRLLQIYIKFKPWSKEGELYRRWANSKFHPRKPTAVKLYLNYGYLMLRVEIGDCRLTVASYQPIQVGSWVNVLVVVTGSGAAMRVDDNDEYYRNSFPPKCLTNDPEFDGEMTVGRNFVGEISTIIVNFIPVSLHVRNLTRLDRSCQEFKMSDEQMSPFFAFNSFNIVSVEERTLSLDNRIMAPCFQKSSSWSIRIVLKTEIHDGVVLIITNGDASEMLALEFEPYRISATHFAPNGCTSTVHQLIDHHVGRWVLVDMDKDEGSSIGLAANGGLRKTMPSNDRNPLTCSGHIAIGDVDEYLAQKVCTGRRGHHRRSMKGQIAHLSIDGIEIDLSLLPSESPSTKQKSSESFSRSKNYVEYVVENGKPLELRCLHPWKAINDMRVGQLSPLWLYSTIPIEPMKKMPWGGFYNSHSYTTHSILYADNYTKNQVDGFYSCWLANNANISPIIITYGVTVHLSPSRDSSFRTALIGQVLFCTYFIVIAISAAASMLLYAAIVFLKTRDAAENERKISEKESAYVLLHSPYTGEFGVHNKLVEKIVHIGRALEDTPEE